MHCTSDTLQFLNYIYIYIYRHLIIYHIYATSLCKTMFKEVAVQFVNVPNTCHSKICSNNCITKPTLHKPSHACKRLSSCSAALGAAMAAIFSCAVISFGSWRHRAALAINLGWNQMPTTLQYTNKIVNIVMSEEVVKLIYKPAFNKYPIPSQLRWFR